MQDTTRWANSRMDILVLVLCASLLFPANHCHLQQSNERAALFIFGDSFFDAGNNNYINTSIRANFWPYGNTFFKHPTGRYSDGRLIPDFIAEYANLPLVKPYLEPGFSDYSNGVNFASAGAGSLAEVSRGEAIDLGTQLNYFKDVEKTLSEELGETEAKTLLSSSVYLFSIGTNDYLFPFLSNTSVLESYSFEEYVGMVISNITKVIEEVYMSGGRKFGILNLGPIGCMPYVRAYISRDKCFEEINHLVELHNDAILKSLQKLKGRLEGFAFSIFDSYTFLTERMNSPSKYGFEEGKKACCGSGPYRGLVSCGGRRGIKEFELCENPTNFLFFDFVHPTERANKQLAEMIWRGEPDSIASHGLQVLLKEE